MAKKTKKMVEYGANRTLHIRLPDRYWDVLFAMTQMSGESPEKWAREAIEYDIKSLCDDGAEYFGQLLIKGWRETLED